MNKIKQQFSDMRKSVPKHIQWLLLVAAFIVVLILLTLLLTGGGDKKVATNADDVPVNLIITPDKLDWTDTVVGDQKTQNIKISATAPARILAVRHAKKTDGFTYTNTCVNMGDINDKLSCTITVTFKPTADMAAMGAPIFIDWRGANESDEMMDTAQVMITLSAVSPVIAEPTPVAKPEPKMEPEPEPEPVSVRDEIIQEIETIAPAMPFEEEIIKPAKKPAPIEPTPKVEAPAPAQNLPEACSDFAFPGFNSSGNQIGWIKPEGGAYYFHPFADKTCDNPTGVYNPDNGIITSIDGSGKKIGTDAEHIGHTTIVQGQIPQLSNAPAVRTINRARQFTADELMPGGGMGSVIDKNTNATDKYQSTGIGTIANTMPYDRSFILRQYKPIPATIVSDIRADPEALRNNTLPVRATVDRNVYADNGRTVIIPTGTLLMGYVSGELPGPYTTIGRMDIRWYQFILPNGVEFNFPGGGGDPFSADAQGRTGVPGRGSTDYLEQFVMPMLTAIVPAAVNMIAPVADKFVNQIDLDNNTVVQSGTMRSSELAKNEIITAWNQVAQKLMVDMMDNTVPPFSIAAGTRITVYSPVDLQVTCGSPDDITNPDRNKKCAIAPYDTSPRGVRENNVTKAEDGSWVGQVRSFNMQNYCVKDDNGNYTAMQDCATGNCGGYDYRTILFFCQSMNYKAINNVRQEVLYQNQQSASNANSVASYGGIGTVDYNKNVLGLQYADEDETQIINPFQTLPKEEAPASITCEDGTNPDSFGCCTGETYTDMGDQGFNCCPDTGGDCFPPIL